jgi:hypothetical protein
MAKEIQEAASQSLANFMRATTTGTNVAIRQAEAERLARMAKQKAEQFQATEERMQSTTLMQGLLSLLGMESEKRMAAWGIGQEKKFDPTDVVNLTEEFNSMAVNLDNATKEAFAGNAMLQSYMGQYRKRLNLYGPDAANDILESMQSLPKPQTPKGGVILDNVLELSFGAPGDFDPLSKVTLGNHIDSAEYDNQWLNIAGVNAEGRSLVNQIVREIGDTGATEGYANGSVTIPGTAAKQHVGHLREFSSTAFKLIEKEMEERLDRDPNDEEAKTVNKIIKAYKRERGILAMSEDFAQRYFDPTRSKQDPFVQQLMWILNNNGITLNPGTVLPEGSEKVFNNARQLSNTKLTLDAYSGQVAAENPQVGRVLNAYYINAIGKDIQRIQNQAISLEKLQEQTKNWGQKQTTTYSRIDSDLALSGIYEDFEAMWPGEIQTEDGGTIPQWKNKKKKILNFLAKAESEQDSEREKSAKEYATKALQLIYREDTKRKLKDYIIDTMDIPLEEKGFFEMFRSRYESYSR